MKKQKVMSEMKGQDKISEKQLNEVEIGTLPEKEFRIMIVKMNQDREYNGGKDWEDEINLYQRPTKTKEETEMKKTLEGINSKITETEEQINDLEDRMMEITAIEYRKKNEKKWRQPERPLGQH